MQKIDSLIFEFLQEILKNKEVIWYLTGSIIEESYDEFSDLNLVVDLLDEKNVINYLRTIQCNSLYKDSYHDLKVFEYKGLIITIQNHKILDEYCVVIPVNKYLEYQTHIRCYKKFVPYLVDKDKFQKETEKIIAKIYSCITKIIVAYGRKDQLFFDKNINYLKYSILDLCEYVTKNGWYIDNKRVMPYLHDNIIKVFLNNLYDKSLFNELSLNEVFYKIADIIMIFNIMLYEIERILQISIDTIGICNVLKRYDINCIEISPKSDECLSKYNLEMSNIYDIYRDDFIFSKKIQKILGPLISGKNIFEIGVGTGMIAEKIIPFSLTYTGLENSMYMLERFKQKCNEKGCINTFFILADMMNIDQFINDSYDIYLERASLMFCIDPLNVVEKLAKKAKKGSIFLRLDIKEESNNEFNDVMGIFNSSISQYDGMPIVLKEFDEIKLINQFLTSKGLDVKKIKLFEWDYKIKIETMLYSLKNRCIPYIQKFSSESITYGVECVKKYLAYKKFNESMELVVKKAMYAYITKF